MEEIEYLEEYKDIVLPAINSVASVATTNPHRLTANVDEEGSSSSLDQDIFNCLFDDNSDDENDEQQQNNNDQTVLSQELLSRSSLDSIDLLNDLGEQVAREFELKKSKAAQELQKNNSIESVVKTNTKVSSTPRKSSGNTKPQPLNRTTLTITKGKSVATVRPTIQSKELQNKSSLGQHQPRISSTSTSNTSSNANTSRQSLINRDRKSQAANTSATSSSSLAKKNITPSLKQQRPATIVKPEKIITKDPPEDPLNFDELSSSESANYSVSDISGETYNSISDFDDDDYDFTSHIENLDDEEDESSNSQIIDISNDSSGSRSQFEDLRASTPSPVVSDDRDLSTVPGSLKQRSSSPKFMANHEIIKSLLTKGEKPKLLKLITEHDNADKVKIKDNEISAETQQLTAAAKDESAISSENLLSSEKDTAISSSETMLGKTNEQQDKFKRKSVTTMDYNSNNSRDTQSPGTISHDSYLSVVNEMLEESYAEAMKISKNVDLPNQEVGAEMEIGVEESIEGDLCSEKESVREPKVSKECNEQGSSEITQKIELQKELTLTAEDKDIRNEEIKNNDPEGSHSSLDTRKKIASSSISKKDQRTIEFKKNVKGVETKSATENKNIPIDKPKFSKVRAKNVSNEALKNPTKTPDNKIEKSPNKDRSVDTSFDKSKESINRNVLEGTRGIIKNPFVQRALKKDDKEEGPTASTKAQSREKSGEDNYRENSKDRNKNGDNNSKIPLSEERSTLKNKGTDVNQKTVSIKTKNADDKNKVQCSLIDKKKKKTEDKNKTTETPSKDKRNLLGKKEESSEMNKRKPTLGRTSNPSLYLDRNDSNMKHPNPKENKSMSPLIEGDIFTYEKRGENKKNNKYDNLLANPNAFESAKECKEAKKHSNLTEETTTKPLEKNTRASIENDRSKKKSCNKPTIADANEVVVNELLVSQPSENCNINKSLNEESDRVTEPKKQPGSLTKSSTDKNTSPEIDSKSLQILNKPKQIQNSLKRSETSLPKYTKTTNTEPSKKTSKSVDCSQNVCNSNPKYSVKSASPAQMSTSKCKNKTKTEGKKLKPMSSINNNKILDGSKDKRINSSERILDKSEDKTERVKVNIEMGIADSSETDNQNTAFQNFEKKDSNETELKTLNVTDESTAKNDLKEMRNAPGVCEKVKPEQKSRNITKINETIEDPNNLKDIPSAERNITEINIGIPEKDSTKKDDKSALEKSKSFEKSDTEEKSKLETKDSNTKRSSKDKLKSSNIETKCIDDKRSNILDVKTDNIEVQSSECKMLVGELETKGHTGAIVEPESLEIQSIQCVNSAEQIQSTKQKLEKFQSNGSNNEYDDSHKLDPGEDKSNSLMEIQSRTNISEIVTSTISESGNEQHHKCKISNEKKELLDNEETSNADKEFQKSKINFKVGDHKRKEEANVNVRKTRNTKLDEAKSLLNKKPKLTSSSTLPNIGKLSETEIGTEFCSPNEIEKQTEGNYPQGSTRKTRSTKLDNADLSSAEDIEEAVPQKIIPKIKTHSDKTDEATQIAQKSSKVARNFATKESSSCIIETSNEEDLAAKSIHKSENFNTESKKDIEVKTPQKSKRKTRNAPHTLDDIIDEHNKSVDHNKRSKSNNVKGEDVLSKSAQRNLRKNRHTPSVCDLQSKDPQSQRSIEAKCQEVSLENVVQTNSSIKKKECVTATSLQKTSSRTTTKQNNDSEENMLSKEDLTTSISNKNTKHQAPISKFVQANSSNPAFEHPLSRTLEKSGKTFPNIEDKMENNLQETEIGLKCKKTLLFQSEEGTTKKSQKNPRKTKNTADEVSKPEDLELKENKYIELATTSDFKEDIDQNITKNSEQTAGLELKEAGLSKSISTDVLEKKTSHDSEEAEVTKRSQKNIKKTRSIPDEVSKLEDLEFKENKYIELATTSDVKEDIAQNITKNSEQTAGLELEEVGLSKNISTAVPEKKSLHASEGERDNIFEETCSKGEKTNSIESQQLDVNYIPNAKTMENIEADKSSSFAIVCNKLQLTQVSETTSKEKELLSDKHCFKQSTDMLNKTIDTSNKIDDHCKQLTERTEQTPVDGISTSTEHSVEIENEKKIIKDDSKAKLMKTTPTTKSLNTLTSINKQINVADKDFVSEQTSGDKLLTTSTTSKNIETPTVSVYAKHMDSTPVIEKANKTGRKAVLRKRIMESPVPANVAKKEPFKQRPNSTGLTQSNPTLNMKRRLRSPAPECSKKSSFTKRARMDANKKPRAYDVRQNRSDTIDTVSTGRTEQQPSSVVAQQMENKAASLADVIDTLLNSNIDKKTVDQKANENITEAEIETEKNKQDTTDKRKNRQCAEKQNSQEIIASPAKSPGCSVLSFAEWLENNNRKEVTQEPAPSNESEQNVLTDLKGRRRQNEHTINCPPSIWNESVNDGSKGDAVVSVAVEQSHTSRSPTISKDQTRAKRSVSQNVSTSRANESKVLTDKLGVDMFSQTKEGIENKYTKEKAENTTSKIEVRQKNIYSDEHKITVDYATDTNEDSLSEAATSRTRALMRRKRENATKGINKPSRQGSQMSRQLSLSPTKQDKSKCKRTETDILIESMSKEMKDGGIEDLLKNSKQVKRQRASTKRSTPTELSISNSTEANVTPASDTNTTIEISEMNTRKQSAGENAQKRRNISQAKFKKYNESTKDTVGKRHTLSIEMEKALIDEVEIRNMNSSLLQPLTCGPVKELRNNTKTRISAFKAPKPLDKVITSPLITLNKIQSVKDVSQLYDNILKTPDSNKVGIMKTTFNSMTPFKCRKLKVKLNRSFVKNYWQHLKKEGISTSILNTHKSDSVKSRKKVSNLSTTSMIPITPQHIQSKYSPELRVQAIVTNASQLATISQQVSDAVDAIEDNDSISNLENSDPSTRIPLAVSNNLVTNAEKKEQPMPTQPSLSISVEISEVNNIVTPTANADITKEKDVQNDHVDLATESVAPVEFKNEFLDENPNNLDDSILPDTPTLMARAHTITQAAASALSNTIVPTDIRLLTNDPMVTSTYVPSFGVTPTLVDAKGTRMYTFLHPAKYSRNHGNVLLDYCCPNLDGPMPAIDPTRIHAQIQTPVIELPSFIVLTTKVVTRAALECNSSTIPAIIRKKAEKLRNSIAIRQNLSTSSGAVMNKESSITQPPQLQQAAPQSVLPVMGPPNLSPAPHFSPALNALTKYLPSTTTITAKIRPSLPQPSVSLPLSITHSNVNEQTSDVSVVAKGSPLLNEMQINLLRSNLRRVDVIFKKIVQPFDKLNFTERHQIIDELVASGKFLPKDVDQTIVLMEEYLKQIDSNQMRQITPLNNYTIPVSAPSSPLANLPSIQMPPLQPAPNLASSTFKGSTSQQQINTAIRKVQSTTKQHNSSTTTIKQRQVPIYDTERNVIGYQLQVITPTPSLPGYTKPAILSTSGVTSTSSDANNCKQRKAAKRPAQDSPRVFYTSQPLQTSTPKADFNSLQYATTPLATTKKSPSTAKTQKGSIVTTVRSAGPTSGGTETITTTTMATVKRVTRSRAAGSKIIIVSKSNSNEESILPDVSSHHAEIKNEKDMEDFIG